MLGGAGLARGRADATAAPAKHVTLNQDLVSPWGMDFLPDCRFIVTEKRGTMAIVSADGRTVTRIGTIDNVFTEGQGGLLDVAVDPDFSAGQNWIYYTFAEGPSGSNGTAVGRARLSLANNTLSGHEVIFRQTKKIGGDAHFGSRIVFRGDKTMFVTLGERKEEAPAQDLTKTLGKVVRINRDGTAAAGNPSLGAGALPVIWTYGHRNPQGAALHPGTGELWVAEHGPQGGDEINIAIAGRNFGWPVVSHGCPYNVPLSPPCAIGGGDHDPPYTEPVLWWPAPSTAPSNMIFYTGNQFPEWRNNILVGALAGETLWRIVLDGNKEDSRVQVFPNLNLRIRDVAQGPDGWIYLLTDSGRLMRVERD
jgi:aldose sugar dehydrogenase